MEVARCPPPPRPAPAAAEAVAGSVERPTRLPLDEASAYRCHLVTYARPGRPAHHAQFEILTARVPPGAGGSGGLGRMIHVQWDRDSRRKLLEVSCVVPKSEAATEALKRHFATDLERVAVGLPGPEALPATRAESWSIMKGLARSRGPQAEFTGNLIWCSYYELGDQLICAGVPCTNEAALRWSDVDRIAADIWYECANGCYVDRGIGFWCPWGGSGSIVEGEDPGENGGSGADTGNGPDGPYAGFLDGCEAANPACNLGSLDSTMVDLIRAAAAGLPPWAGSLILGALDDAAGSRIQYWSNDIYKDGHKVLADVHFGFEADPGARLHLHLDAFSILREILCHEAAHWYYGIRGHGSELTSHIQSCMTYEPQ